MHIELDCKLVIESIYDKNDNQAELANIIVGCTSLLQQSTNFKMNFVRRQTNVVGHIMLWCKLINLFTYCLIIHLNFFIYKDNYLFKLKGKNFISFYVCRVRIT